jgi:hypothetical protein
MSTGSQTGVRKPVLVLVVVVRVIHGTMKSAFRKGQYISYLSSPTPRPVLINDLIVERLLVDEKGSLVVKFVWEIGDSRSSGNISLPLWG